MPARLMSEAEFARRQAKNSQAWGRSAAPIQPAAEVQKPAKYRNQKETDEDGVTHDSKKEARRWRELRLLLRAGELVWLARQVRFALPGETEYWADFAYRTSDGRFVVEDVKSEATRKLPVYRLKKRQMLAIHSIEIVEL
jgi:hypothetical protein